MDFEEIRERSVRRLRALGFDQDLPPHFPPLSEEEVATLRPVADVVARCDAIAAALAVAEGVPAENVMEILRTHGIDRWLAGPERDLVDHRLGERVLPEDELRSVEAAMSWRQEAVWALVWALGLIEELRPDAFCGSAADGYQRMRPAAPDATVPAGVALRPREELAAELDFLFCLHWHARERRLHGQPQLAADPFREGMVEERRRAVEWLFTDEEWEEISLDT